VEDLIPIGEFSDRSGLSAKRLRTYAAEGLIVPAAVDPASGYRYYSPSQLRSAQLIDALRQAGMPLAEIRVLMGEPSLDQLDVWARQLERDSTLRQRALGLARDLLIEIESPSTQQQSERHQEDSRMTTLQTAGRTEKGPVRENNEDVIVATDCLAMIADGMGGHPSGEVAANAVAGAVRAGFSGHSAEELTAAIRAANWAIWDRAAAHSELEGMGTTVCAVGLLEDGRLALASVGDTRAYLWHGGQLTQLTQDHSLTAQLIERGEIRVEDAPLHPHYGILTRALGVGPDVEIDATTLDIEDGDRLLLCSDGLVNELSLTEIASIMIRDDKDLSSMAADLVNKAVDNGGRDNVSAVLAEIAT
jgi:serine/threonine protein phosphatase PrpC